MHIMQYMYMFKVQLLDMASVEDLTIASPVIYIHDLVSYTSHPPTPPSQQTIGLIRGLLSVT